MALDTVLKTVAQVSQFGAVCDFLKKNRGTIQVEGLTSALKGAFIANLYQLLSCHLLIVTYNFEQAEAIYDDLLAFGVESDELVIVPPTDGVIIPGGDTDVDVIKSRLSALLGFLDNKPTVVIAPIAAVLQRTLPPAILSNNLIRIENGEFLDLDECVRRLVDLGYERTPMVERQGEFSRRGGIIDIYPSTADKPFRIELFGDEVESIREFDVETQRSAGEVAFIDVAPARECLLSDEAAERVASQVQDLLRTAMLEMDDEPRRRLETAVEDDILRIENRSYFDGIEYYMPLIFPEPFCMLDYVPSEAVIVVDEPHQIKSCWEQTSTQLLNDLRLHLERGSALPLPGEQVLSFDANIGRIATRKRNLVLSLLSRTVSWLNPDERIALSSAPMDAFGGQIDLLAEQTKTWLGNKCKVVFVSSQAKRIVELLTERGLNISEAASLEKPGVSVLEGNLRSGFKFPTARLMLVTDSEIFGMIRFRRPRKAFKRGLSLSSLLEISEGDYVVHINHGIGRYRGLTKLSGAGGEKDYLLIEYAGTDRLYVPVDQIDRVHKYIGADAQPPALNRLGGTEWQRTTKRVKASVKEMARELLALYAARQTLEGYSYSPDSPWQQELESSFEYEETPDQLEAIQEVKQDLESPKPMDRLICGDVGYGKTEVAIRAVFKVVNDGKQAAVLAPTTVLAQQHFNTFKERLAAYPVNIEMLSRFRSRSEQREVIEGLRTGHVDVVIGTHRLLSKDIQFRDLGLLVVDEEQRFGVAHKERLKQLRKTVDVLTLTATPIPRTLQMSLSGIRDMSLMDDPPEGRVAIKTYCREYDDELVRDAILRELDRNGQVYFVHNRVENIEHVADHVRRLVPTARVEVAHGQMAENDLERVMYDFYRHRFDVLVCTTIIESGLDVPNANTIIINNCDKMGLAQLYQLRGRVGRSNRQAYAYLLYHPNRMMTEAAQKRLEAIKEFSDLGSGFRIALRDLEIRGAGNLLGPEQHGHMAAVGFDMYCRLLAEAVHELKGEDVHEFNLPPADLPLDAYIPSDYIPEEMLRLSFYKKMTAVRNEKDIAQIEEEMRDRFGELPAPVRNSLEILRIRMKAAGTGIEAISFERGQVVMRFAPGIRLAREVSLDLIKRFPGNAFLTDRVIVNGKNPYLVSTLHGILEALPKALEESKHMYLTILK